MEKQTVPQLRSFRIVDYDRDALRNEGYVQFIAEAAGTTRFLHRLTALDPLPQFQLTTRYADLLDVHTQIRTSFATLWMPEFPPKRLIGNKKPEFIESRIQLLNEYFATVLEYPDVRASEPVMRMISPRHTLKFAVVGRAGLPMHEFVQCFTRAPCIGDEGLSVFTIDLLVKKRLCRVSEIVVVEADAVSDPEGFLKRICQQYDGILFCYVSGEQAYTLQLFDQIGEKYPKMLIDMSQDVLNEHIAYSVFYSLTNLTK